ncbi:MAG: MazE/toxin transcriptional modulator MazF [Bacteriovoracaceae bacterium]|nr:MazE/toxin transcriptional modulator MazF [Bacteriovoracaceae bacterium]
MNLEPSSPPEFGKIRPALVVSNSEHNLILDTLVVVPVSSQKPEIWPLRIEFTNVKLKKSYIVLPGIRQVNKSRLEKWIGAVSSDVLQEVDEALALYLGEFN